MDLFDRLAEERIREAQQQGQFDDLPGAGSPLPDDECAAVPGPLRVGYRLLRNAGLVPEELVARRELASLETLTAGASTMLEVEELERRRQRLLLKLALSRPGG